MAHRLAVLVPLAPARGCLACDTGSLWGSTLFHTGADLAVFFGIAANL